MSHQAPRSDNYYHSSSSNNGGVGDPPPGQGHYNQYPESGYRDRFERGPHRSREHGYTPYQETYGGDSAGPPRDSYPPEQNKWSSSRESFTSSAPPPPRSSNSGHAYGERDRDRPYAPSEPRPHPLNQLSPYEDESRTEASWRDWRQEDQGKRDHYKYGRPRPRSGLVSSSSAAGAAAGYGGRSSGEGYRDRYDNDDDEHDDGYDDRDRERRKYPPHSRSRRYPDSSSSVTGNPSDQNKRGRDFFGASEGERGLATNLSGGAGGALIGNKLGRGGAIGTIGGAVVGAIAAQAAERHYVKWKEEKLHVKRSVEDAYAVPAAPYPQRGRDMDDVRESGKASGIRERLRSLSRSARARSRSRSRPARRSPSEDSDEQYHYR